MSETDEGIGGRKWSLLRDAGGRKDETVSVMEGTTEIATLRFAGEKVAPLIM